MKIYLAGKIGFHDWRHDIVDGLGEADLETKVLEKSIRNRHDYVGPFFRNGQHGCSHGERTHGAGETRYNKTSHTHEIVPDEYVWERCVNSINRCDVVIAVVEDDAHGTFCEIGYAYGIGKKVFVIGCEGKQCWFAKGFCYGGFTWFLNETVESVLDYCDEQDDYRGFIDACESAAEAAFAKELIRSRDGLHNRPSPQFKVGPYRIDFAFQDIKLAIEIDGIEFHGNQTAFIADRKRTRYLESLGWRVMRFAAKEVLDSETCSDVVEDVWQTVAECQIRKHEANKQLLSLTEWEAQRNGG